MVYSLLYAHNFEDEDALYKALSNLDPDSDHILIDNNKHRNAETLIKSMAKRLGIKVSDMPKPCDLADRIIIIYDDGVYEIHEGKQCSK